MNTPPIVSVEWLHNHLNDPTIVLLDASQRSITATASSSVSEKKIKGARFFDLKGTFSKPSGQFPNTFPSVEQFEAGCRALGIHNSSTIVVYDNLGIYTSPRVWWMLKTMGHEEVYVLNGGLPAWIEKGYETVDQYVPASATGDFTADFDTNKVKDLIFIDSNISQQSHVVIDARSEGRFNGTATEPRPGLPSGHIPNSLNIPYEDVLEKGKFKSPEQLKAIFHSLKDEVRPLVFSCGSGITACIVLLAAEIVLSNPTAVYDGSWTEWASLKLL